MEIGLGRQLDSPTLLTNLETCPRKAYWANWTRNKLRPVEILRQSLNHAVSVKESQDGASWGDTAGSKVLELASCPGMEADSETLYASVMNYACLSDILVSTIRKATDAAWLVPDHVQNWTSGALLSPEGTYLRRLVIVSHWTKERHYSECRNWFTLGEMATYDLPMQMVVLVIGHERNGRRHSHWTKALLHPANMKQLRFRRVGRNVSGGFKESWVQIFREDREDISRETWLNSMLKDDVLSEICFKVDMPKLEPHNRKMVLELAERKLEAIDKMRSKPDKQYTGCDWPIKCEFLNCCHSLPEKSPSEKLGFVQISTRTQVSLAGSCK